MRNYDNIIYKTTVYAKYYYDIVSCILYENINTLRRYLFFLNSITIF